MIYIHHDFLLCCWVWFVLCDVLSSVGPLVCKLWIELNITFILNWFIPPYIHPLSGSHGTWSLLHIGQEAPWTCCQCISGLTHIWTNKHIHTLLSSVASLLMIPPVCWTRRAEGEYQPPVISLCLTKIDTWNRQGTRYSFFLEGWGRIFKNVLNTKQ